MTPNPKKTLVVSVSVNVVQSEWDAIANTSATIRSTDGAIEECVEYVKKALRQNLREGGACSVVCGVKRSPPK